LQVKKLNVSYYTAIPVSVNKKLDRRINVCYNSQNQQQRLPKLLIFFSQTSRLRNSFLGKKGDKKHEEKFKNAFQHRRKKAAWVPQQDGF